jgi:hypothetical protein
MSKKATSPQFAVCVRNDECEDLELRKVYRVLPDRRAARDRRLRVVDESGEDYLYPGSYFVRVRLPAEAQRTVATMT